MNKKIKGLKYTVILKPQPQGVFTVNVPALPGCITEGRTKEEALKNAKEAIELYIETLIEDGKSIPEDMKPVTQVIRLNFAPLIYEEKKSFIKA